MAYAITAELEYVSSAKAFRLVTYEGTCYACDGKPTGYTNHNGKVVHACSRHTDPSVKPILKALCVYCDGIAPRGFDVDGAPAHKKCHREQCQD